MKATRQKAKENTEKKEEKLLPTTPVRDENDTFDNSPKTRLATRSFSPNNDKSTKCVICNQTKHKGATALFRIGEPVRAATFLAAYQFQKDDVYRRCDGVIIFIHSRPFVKLYM